MTDEEFNKKIEAAILETLVVTNKQSIHHAVNKIRTLVDKSYTLLCTLKTNDTNDSSLHS